MEGKREGGGGRGKEGEERMKKKGKEGGRSRRKGGRRGGRKEGEEVEGKREGWRRKGEEEAKVAIDRENEGDKDDLD